MPISQPSLSSKNAAKPPVALFDFKPRSTTRYVAAYPVVEIHYNGEFIRLPKLSYAYGQTLVHTLSKSTRMNFNQMLDFLAHKFECEIRALYFCRPLFALSTGLTIVECDNDIKRMYELAEEYGLIGLYIAHEPDNLSCFYYHNLIFNLLDEPTRAKIAIHDKLVELATSNSASDIAAWEEEEKRSPPLRSPPFQTRSRGIECQGNNLFMDFLASEIVHADIGFSDDEWYYGGFLGSVSMDVGCSTSSVPQEVVKDRSGHKVSRKPYARRHYFQTPRAGLRKFKISRHFKALTRDWRRGGAGLKANWFLKNGRLECRYFYAACS